MFRDKIEGYDYYIPECVELYDLLEISRNVTGLFFIQNEDWQEVNDRHEAELENENTNEYRTERSNSTLSRQPKRRWKSENIHQEENDDGYLELRYNFKQ